MPSYRLKLDDPSSKLKEARGALGVSQSQFSSLAGISLQLVKAVEQGRRHLGGPLALIVQMCLKRPNATLLLLSELRDDRETG